MTSDGAARRRVAGTGVLLLALVGALVLTMGAGHPGERASLIRWYALSWVLFAAAVWALRKVPGRQAVFLVVAGAAAVTTTGLLAPPTTSTDSYRYVWDGRVQAAGVSPYAYAPADPALLPLRDRWLFPEGADCDFPYRYPVHSGPAARTCTLINRPDVPTIYPPLAELYFLVVHRLAPEGGRHRPFQVGGALLAFGTSLVLLAALRRRAADSAAERGADRGAHRAACWAACWAWCPAVPLEAVNNAHVDILGVLLTVAAMTVLSRHKVWGGLLLGAATAVKFLPALALPGALSGLLATRGPSARRRALGALAVVGPAVLVIALAYLPYVLASRTSVLGYLFGYLNEEGYDDTGTGGARYALLRLVLPGAAALPAALVLLAVAAVLVLRQGDADRPWRGALVVTGVAFLLFTPGYSWYALLVVALAAFDGRWEWLGIPLAGAVAYLGVHEHVGTAAYAVAALAVVAGSVVRARRTCPALSLPERS
ncbi:glycosyltransferase 87 family protein [Nonomuraea fuscirosea]|uniref:glycosyltransferase 87 family protein n=1 Tax=Nonomuraea fuscirosea TaxID=1291556 RepID=UPI0034454E05